MPLFSYKGLDEVLREQEGRITTEVEKLTRDQVISLPEDQLVEYVVSKLRIQPIVLHTEQQVAEVEETKVDVSRDRRRVFFDEGRQVWVPGHRTTVTIPFAGEAALFGFRPNTYRTTAPYATFNGDTRLLTIVYEQPADEPIEQIKPHIERAIADIGWYLDQQQSQLDAFNKKLPAETQAQVRARKVRLGVQNDIQKMLGIPIKKRVGAANIEAINLHRHIVRRLPPVPVGGFPAEPGISVEDYEHILGVIRHAGRTFERTPKTYAVHDEEELRDIVLANLNTHYAGKAGGETFRRAGKTDICIEENSRAAFVAECKVWRGASEFNQAIEQLLSYLTWRDCKTALVVFNKKNAKFSELLAKLPVLVESHPCFRRRSKSSEAGEWKFTMTDPKDDGREVQMALFVFDLHV